MDSISQAALGASIGEAVLGRQIGRKGAILGAVVATIPDMDVLLLPLYDPLQRISIHRGYSHSILFSLIGAIVLAVLFRRMKWTKTFSWNRLFLFTWLALFTHMLLDAFTCYGTQLFLPFSDMRVSFDSVTIVDPFYTIPLVIGLVLALWRYRNQPLMRKWANGLGLLLSSLYLFVAVMHHQMVQQSLIRAMDRQGIVFDHILTVPVLAGGLKWYTAASNQDTLYLGSLSYVNMTPISFTPFPIHREWLDGIDRVVADRMQWFAKDHFVMTGSPDTIRFYNLQVDMQGIRETSAGLAPTAWYYEIITHADGTYDLRSFVHQEEEL